jgi:hypothetical protein
MEAVAEKVPNKANVDDSGKISILYCVSLLSIKD